MLDVALYSALFLGVILEGEFALLAGTLAAEEGMLDIRLVFLIAFAGTLVTDWGWFFAGKLAGSALLTKVKPASRYSEKVNKLLTRYPVAIVFLYRFLYGFRIVSLVILGVTGFSPKKFLPLSFLSILLWTSVFGLLGIFLGEIFTRMLQHADRFAMMAIIGLAGCFILISTFRRFFSRYLLKSSTTQAANALPLKRSQSQTNLNDPSNLPANWLPGDEQV